MPKPKNNLTEKQKRFCELYMVDLNATQAAIGAGYSKKTARDIGCENLAKPNIADYLQELRLKQQKRTEITADRVLEEIANIAFTNLEDFMSVDDDQCAIINPDDRPEKSKSALKKVKVTRLIVGSGDNEKEVEKVELETHDKIAALDKLCRHLGIYEKDNRRQVEVTGRPQLFFGDTSKKDEGE